MTPPATTQPPSVMAKVSRIAEIALAFMGASMLFGDKVVQWVVELRGVEMQHSIDWTNLLAGAILIAPFTLGRATAGQVWVRFGEAFSSRLKKTGTVDRSA